MNTNIRVQSQHLKQKNWIISSFPNCHISHHTTTYLSTYTFDDTMAKGMTYSKDAVIAIYDSKDAADSTNVNNVDRSGAIAVWKSSDAETKFSATYGTSGMILQ